jgi:hypothetical protein
MHSMQWACYVPHEGADAFGFRPAKKGNCSGHEIARRQRFSARVPVFDAQAAWLVDTATSRLSSTTPVRRRRQNHVIRRDAQTDVFTTETISALRAVAGT